MSRPTTDPLLTLVGDGRLGFRPETQFGAINVIDLHLDLDQLRNNLEKWLVPIFSNHHLLRCQYYGIGFKAYSDDDQITKAIQSDVEKLLNIAISICYNRLRKILEIWNFVGYTSRMDLVSVDNETEMPTFLASLLSSIGPLRLHDGVVDKIYVYVPTSTMRIDNCRRNVERLLEAMRECNIGLSAIDFSNVTLVGNGGFTTIRHIVDAGKWDTYGTVHPSNYDNEDVVRSYLFANSDLGFVPVVQPAVGCTVNTHKFQPSHVSTAGRDDNSVFLSVLARDVSVSEIKSMIYYRIVSP